MGRNLIARRDVCGVAWPNVMMSGKSKITWSSVKLLNRLVISTRVLFIPCN